jgi:restriction system protein
MIPDYQTLMLPVLKQAADQEINTRDVIERLAGEYQLSEEEREQMLPSGKQRTFDNRVHWAKGYLKQAGLVRYPKRGFYIATDEGRKVLAENPERIDVNYLKKYDAFQDFQSRKGTKSGKADDQAELPDDDATPDEILRAAHKQINAALSADLLDRVRQASPAFFEDLIVDLLLAMGYGGTSEDAGRALGKSGDDGVDGVIDQDPLGVDQIYVQAKRYAEGNNIGSGAIRDFFGALSLKKAQKGIFVTTSSFSPSALQTAKDLGTRIVLIDGNQLARLLIRYNIGCRDEEVLHLKKIDEDFFEYEV